MPVTSGFPMPISYGWFERGPETAEQLVPQQAHSLVQDPLEGLVKPFVLRQSAEPRRRSGAFALFGIQGGAPREAMQDVELTASFRRHFQELESPPFPAFQKHRTVLALIPRAELGTPILRSPDADGKNPWPRL